MERHAPSRTRLWLVVAPLILLVIASYIGDALAPTLVTEHPAWLITLNARNRNLVLVSNELEALPYYLIGGVRLVLSDPLFYLLGWWYGDAAVLWVEKRSTSFGSMLRTWERLFKKAAWALVAIAPNNVICLFAGASGMSPPTFLVLNVAGTVGRLYLLRVVGDIFQPLLDDLLGFIRDYRLPLTGLTIVLVVVTIWVDRRSGETELEALANIEEELEEAEEELEELEELETEAEAEGDE